MNTLNININLNNGNEKEFIDNLITSILANQNININLNFNNEDIKEVTTDKEKLYDLVSDKVKVPKEDFFKLLDLLDNSLDDSLTGVQKIEKQCMYIRNAFNSMDNNELESILNARSNLYRIISNDEIYLIHKDRGGIIDGSFDDFDCCFVLWVATRGTKFLINYLNYGPYFVMGYIHNNNISEDEYFNDGISEEFFFADERIEEYKKFYKAEPITHKIYKDDEDLEEDLEEDDEEYAEFAINGSSF